jgi:hypothetical protein
LAARSIWRLRATRGEASTGFGVRDGEHVGMRRRHVEPGRKSGEARAVLLHAADRPGRHQLRPQHPEEVHEADQEIFDLLVFRDFREINGHGPYLPRSLSGAYSLDAPCHPPAREARSL